MKNNLMNRKTIHVDKINNIPVATFKQEDDGVLKLALFSNLIVLDCTGQNVRLDIKRPDCKLVTIETGIVIANKNEIDIKMTTNCFIVSGLLECDIVLTDINGKMTTASFFITVNKKVTGSDNLVGSNAIGVLDEIKKDYEDWKDSALAGAGDGHTHTNKSLLDGIDTLKITYWDSKASGSHRHDASEIDNLPTSENNSYIHPSTHPASMITGLSNVATTGNYNDLTDIPTAFTPEVHNHVISQIIDFPNLSNVATSGSYSDLKDTPMAYNLPVASSIVLGGVKIGANLNIDSNGVLSAVASGGSSGTITVENTLDSYSGATLNDKMVAMFNDINTNKQAIPMEIILPSGVIEVTQDLKAIKWTNKVFRCNGTIQFTNCNGIEFVQCQHNDIFIHRIGSVAPTSDNVSGLINPSAVASLTKRGIKITDCSYNRITINTFVGFTNAIEFYSEYGAKGTFYNNIYFTDIWRCKRPMTFATGKASDDTNVTQSGWITEIFIHGGKFDCEDGVLVGQELADRPANEPGDNYQGIKFYNLGVEHVRKQAEGVGIYFLQGKGNAVINPRFEGSLLTGNPTSGAYVLVKESIYAWANRIETSNYPINIDRVVLNYSAKQANGTSDCPCSSYITGMLYDNEGGQVGNKAIATPGAMFYESHTLTNYYFKNYAKPNSIKYTFSTTEFARVKRSDGKVFAIPYGTEITT